MKLFSNTSIRQRLTVIITGISCVVLLAAVGIISVIGVYTLRNNIMADLDVSATIVGDRNSAAISFGKNLQVSENLSIFSLKPPIVQACVYDSEGKEFASYVSPRFVGRVTCPTNTKPRALILDDRIELLKPIAGDFSVSGYIYVESTLEQVDKYIVEQGTIALTVALGALLGAYFLAVNLQKAISQPLLNLTNVARQITENKNYSLRAPVLGNPREGEKNEMVVLTHSFNNMLTEIGARDQQLQDQNLELERSRDIAESANRAKSQFLANISHELRTPLNAIIGFSSILMNQLFGALGDAKYLEYAQDINESGAHLLDIINDILDLSKAEAGKLSLAFEEVHVAKVIQKCITIMAERAEKGQVTIRSHVPKILPPLVADRLRFIQIVLNVLSNAVKFTNPGGHVDIEVVTRDVSGAITHFLVIIRDTGIGMSPEDIHKAFQSFGQVDSGLNRKYEGTGLGLPLTKKLVELHEGHIDIQSEAGKGTTVTLTLPAVPKGGFSQDSAEA